MLETAIIFAVGVFFGSSLGVFLMALAVAAKREDDELEELRSQEDMSHYSTTYLPQCRDCKHYIRHDKRCGYWNYGVDPMNGCNFGERRDDEIDGSVPY